jgi:hypothetical protein
MPVYDYRNFFREVGSIAIFFASPQRRRRIRSRPNAHHKEQRGLGNGQPENIAGQVTVPSADCERETRLVKPGMDLRRFRVNAQVRGSPSQINESDVLVLVRKVGFGYI